MPDVFTTSRIARPVLAACALLAALIGSLEAVQRRIVREVRDRYEGSSMRLRVDLRAATRADDPNVIGRGEPALTRKAAAVLFNEFETVYVGRIAREGRSRLNLTVYRSREEAERLRASAVPPPPGAPPSYGGTLGVFAQQSSTSVILELEAEKSEPDRQREEIEALLRRVFYVDAKPTFEDLESYVRRHPGLPVPVLRARTGLDPERIRALVEEARSKPGDGD